VQGVRRLVTPSLHAVTRVKICGITRPEDADLAVDLGAWALGFILWPGSPRAADPAVAAGIAAQHRRRAAMVGVFVDPTLDEVAAQAQSIGLTHLQLHGQVGPSFCKEAARRTGCQVIRAFRIGANADVADADRFREVDFHLYDSRVKGLEGGSGQAWDWTLVAKRLTKVPLILSGGLTPDNVAEGIAAVAPYAVDVASGTEAEPGVKDPEKVRAFIEAAHAGAPA
jgi:phosphoribosylanthranilate isomerase